MGRNDRKKASEIFHETHYVFSKKVSFDEAFPQIDDLIVTVAESGEGIRYHSNVSTYTKSHFPGEYIDCSNPLCYNGGFSIGNILREMVSKNLNEYKTSASCRGNEASAKGKRIYRKCINSFKISVSIKYKTEISTNS